LFVGQTEVVADSRKKTLTNWRINGIIGGKNDWYS
jgi:hypothetical protein